MRLADRGRSLQPKATVAPNQLSQTWGRGTRLPPQRKALMNFAELVFFISYVLLNFY